MKRFSQTARTRVMESSLKCKCPDMARPLPIRCRLFKRNHPRAEWKSWRVSLPKIAEHLGDPA